MRGVYAPTPLGKGSTRAWGLMPSASVGFVSFEKPTNRVYSLSSGSISGFGHKSQPRIAHILTQQRFRVLKFISPLDFEFVRIEHFDALEAA